MFRSGAVRVLWSGCLPFLVYSSGRCRLLLTLPPKSCISLSLSLLSPSSSSFTLSCQASQAASPLSPPSPTSPRRVRSRSFSAERVAHWLWERRHVVRERESVREREGEGEHEGGGVPDLCLELELIVVNVLCHALLDLHPEASVPLAPRTTPHPYNNVPASCSPPAEQAPTACAQRHSASRRARHHTPSERAAFPPAVPPGYHEHLI